MFESFGQAREKNGARRVAVTSLSLLGHGALLAVAVMVTAGAGITRTIEVPVVFYNAPPPPAAPAPPPPPPPAGGARKSAPRQPVANTETIKKPVKTEIEKPKPEEKPRVEEPKPVMEEKPVETPPVKEDVQEKLPDAPSEKVEQAQPGGETGGTSNGKLGGQMGGAADGKLGGPLGNKGTAPVVAPKPAVDVPRRLAAGDHPAVPIKQVEPVYPKLARDARMEGRVMLMLVVDRFGNVVDARALSGPELLRASAVEAVKQWKYSPARSKDGEAIMAYLPQPIEFRLR